MGWVDVTLRDGSHMPVYAGPGNTDKMAGLLQVRPLALHQYALRSRRLMQPMMQTRMTNDTANAVIKTYPARTCWGTTGKLVLVLV